MIDAKSLRISFDKMDEFIRVYDGTRCLVLFGTEKYDALYNRIGYRLGVKSSITYEFSHNHAKIKNDLFDSLPPEETLTFHNVIIHINPVLNKDQNHYYYNTFLEKCSYQSGKQ